MYTLSVDIGGTFTDVVVFDEAKGRTVVGKALTTPGDLRKGVMTGLEQAADDMDMPLQKLLGEAHRFVHATTQSSNAIFAFAGAKTAVVTTRGFGDTLTIMRATGRVAGLSVFERYHYRATEKPRLLADERDIFEVTERMDYAGRGITRLDEKEMRDIARKIKAQGYQAVAVAFLFSHKSDAHEKRAREILREEMPGVYVTISSEVAPVLGEYERSATTLFNAYVGPVIESYLEGMVSTLGQNGLKCKPLIAQANGGLATPAQTIPIFTVESGPAAGVVGSAYLANQLGVPNVIATDVGGTTFKVAIIEGGKWTYSKETILNQYQLRLPMIDVVSIGAGGGSIAWVDNGRLRIGPMSASSDPGPACYGFGSDRPTVTDADLVLGHLSADKFLGGRMKLDVDAASAAIHKHIAVPLFNGDVIAAAAGIRRVVDSQMADLIRKTTLQRGHDPRAFALMAYGGSGPVHAASYGADLGMSEIIIPFNASVHSAYGSAQSDVRFSLRYSDPLTLPVEPAKLESLYTPMETSGDKLLLDADVAPADRRFERWVEARYRRQVHTVRVRVPGRLDSVARVDEIAVAFEAEYERLFGPGSALKDAGIEMVDYGVDAIGIVQKPSAARQTGGSSTAPRLRRQAYCPVVDAMVDTPIYDGAGLPAGATVSGPAMIEHPGTTIVLHTGHKARIDEFGNTRIVSGH
ncbi:hydantoinase/oxoprolinase family protein [Bradyrhizobium sp. dw_411]|uniref:hydantoinase/oxoprolinase family protein n=1 Tax=Bradyrhizobium sp. dw_411 TaxID=2720082 RepID=UPI001BCFA851|nr:hydantoinase/oxoprolinase family protein [Bradyrhizobium sp. dw_411]